MRIIFEYLIKIYNSIYYTVFEKTVEILNILTKDFIYLIKLYYNVLKIVLKKQLSYLIVVKSKKIVKL